MKKKRQFFKHKTSNLYEYSKDYLPYNLLAKIGLNRISKEEVKNVINQSALGVIIGLFNLFVFFELSTLSGDKKSFVFLTFPFLVAAVFYGGGLAIIVALAITLFGNNYFLGQAYFSLETGIILFSSIATTFIIRRAKKIDELRKYRQREKQYANSFVALQARLRKSKEEITARDEFLSFASHELKSPLTAMLLQLHTMLYNIRNVSLANFSINKLMNVLENAEQQIRRLTKMINDLLNVSLITTGRLDLELEKMDLSKSVNNVLRTFSAELKRQKYKINLKSNGPVTGKWDKVRIEQVITNLISNAIRYGEQKPIILTVENRGRLARFSIQDHGIGILPDQQRVIFTPFKRGVSKNYKQGLGVGLYIVAQIIRAHSGSIRVDSKLGAGSTFIIELPSSK